MQTKLEFSICFHQLMPARTSIAIREQGCLSVKILQYGVNAPDHLSTIKETGSSLFYYVKCRDTCFRQRNWCFAHPAQSFLVHTKLVPLAAHICMQQSESHLPFYQLYQCVLRELLACLKTSCTLVGQKTTRNGIWPCPRARQSLDESNPSASRISSCLTVS